ncbi:MAG: tyrosine-protein phosphatase [Chloroherpetonaceae bacterium]|nr:tyrosine-protein phosphatase [Chthonomonadaceae bacterium]MDW8207438.1 tyrosine-protein phosphatase [Chloroherpetonaceae bacterium]
MRLVPATCVVLCVLCLLCSATARASDLPNFHPVSPGIYRGAAPTEAGLRRLRAMGIRTIVDLRISPKQVQREKVLAEKLGFRWMNLPMGSDPPTQKQVDTLIATLRQARTSPVFVHCQHGADRTGCMIGIWRVAEEGWTYAQAYREMRRYGFKPYYTRLASAVRQRARPSTIR